MKRFLRKWLGIEQNEIDIAFENKSRDNLTRRFNNSVSNISTNQSRIEAISNKLKKH